MFECEEDVRDDKTRRRQIFLLSENCLCIIIIVAGKSDDCGIFLLHYDEKIL